jgi:hypothetical protein
MKVEKNVNLMSHESQAIVLIPQLKPQLKINFLFQNFIPKNLKKN